MTYGGQRWAKVFEVFEKYLIDERESKYSVVGRYLVVVKVTFRQDGKAMPPDCIPHEANPDLKHDVQELRRAYGNHVWVRTLTEVHRKFHPPQLWPVRERETKYTYRWISTGGRLVEVFAENRNPKEVVQVYLRKHPSKHRAE